MKVILKLVVLLVMMMTMSTMMMMKLAMKNRGRRKKRTRKYLKRVWKTMEMRRRTAKMVFKLGKWTHMSSGTTKRTTLLVNSARI